MYHCFMAVGLAVRVKMDCLQSPDPARRNVADRFAMPKMPVAQLSAIGSYLSDGMRRSVRLLIVSRLVAQLKSVVLLGEGNR